MWLTFFMIDFKISSIYQMTGLVKSVNFELFIGVRFEYKSSSVFNSRRIRSIDTVQNEKIYKTVALFECTRHFFRTMNSERKGKSMKYQIATAIVILASLSPVTSEAKDQTTQHQRYYVAYEKIVQKINRTNENADITLLAADQFADEDWVSPKRFQERVVKRLKPLRVQTSLEWDSERTLERTERGNEVRIIGNFETELLEQSKRQRLSDVFSMTSLAVDDGKWTQTGFSGTPIDALQTMVVTVSGTYAKQGILTRHHITKEYHCSWYGEIYY